MGQSHSNEHTQLTPEALTTALTNHLAHNALTPLELRSFKLLFRSLSSTEPSSHTRYWTEATLCRFLHIPDVLGVGPVVFQLVSYLGAFPFAEINAPAILTAEALLRAVVVGGGRWGEVVKKSGKGNAGGVRGWRGMLWRGLAVRDRGLSVQLDKKEGKAGQGVNDKESEEEGIVEQVEEALHIGGGEAEEEDEVSLSALDLLDARHAFEDQVRSDVRHSVIPSDNFQRLLQLLLLIAPLDAQESLASYQDQVNTERIDELRRTAACILRSFCDETSLGVTFATFMDVVENQAPYILNSLPPLFEHFLFTDDIEALARKGSISSIDDAAPSEPSAIPEPLKPSPTTLKPTEPHLPPETDLLDLALLSQLSFFIPGSSLFRGHLRPLYSGARSGFSMGAFEKGVFNWRAPTILLVAGTLLPDHPSSSRERTFADSLPPKRYPSTKTPGQSSPRFIFGAYIPMPWQHTPKRAFGDQSTILFRLSPFHDIFRASTLVQDYITFTKSPNPNAGIAIGCPAPINIPHSTRSHQQISLGPVSLYLDDALEFGVFTHLAEGGGSFRPSTNPVSLAGSKDFQDRFSIEQMEVWGCGGDEEAERQRKAWAWEEKEAERRRRVNLGTGDVEADKELLRLAGIIGGERSGGSMG